jgi:alkylation response protein AidB-like acyl-CoA dehydrogenase
VPEINVSDPGMAADDELSMVRESASAFVRKRTNYDRSRTVRNNLPGFAPELLAEIVELGWPATLIPDSHGGLGLSFAAMSAILQELGRGLLGEPLVATAVLGTRVILHGDNPELQALLLPQIAAGTLVPCLAWQEADGSIEPNSARATVSGASDAQRLTGRKEFVSGAVAAHGYAVTAMSARGLGLYWVEAGSPGLLVEHGWRADGSTTTTIEFSDTPIAAIIASPNLALAAVERAVDEAIVMAAAEMFGVLSQALSITLEYMRTRVQFDKPIGSFQALQHRAVDLFVLQEISESVLADAAQALDRDLPRDERRRIVSRTKARLSDAGMRITREAIQLHGAIGYTDEYQIGLYLKRAMVLSAWLGNSAEHRRRFIGAGGLARVRES